MKKYAQGKLHERIAVAGNPMYPAYVVQGESHNLMIDAGINHMGPLYLKSLCEILGDDCSLHYLFLTHSHYDHLGSMPYLKRNVAWLKVGGSPIISELMRKESVIQMMTALSSVQRDLFKDAVGDEDVSITPVPVDIELRDGDRIDLGGLTCEVFEAPGHTRDSLAYYFPEIGALFPGEAAGVPMGESGVSIHPQFLASFDRYIESLRRLIKLKPRFIGIGHGYVLTDDDALPYLESSIRATCEYRKMIEFYLDRAGWDADRAIETIVRKEYDEKGTIFQERNAYIINLTAQVREIARLNKN